MELGEQIATLREEQALTQVELAVAARISPSTLSQIESGKVPSPHVGTVRKIARALGVEPAELRRTKELAFSGKGPAPRSMDELLERAGAADGHLAMSTPELMQGFEGLSYQEALQLARAMAKARGAIKPILEQYRDTDEGKLLTALAAERNIVAQLCFQVIAERERGVASARGDLDRIERIERELKEVA